MRQPLLCPNHHRIIDDLEADRWPVGRLLELKLAHESATSSDLVIDSALLPPAVLALIVQGGLSVSDLESLLEDLRPAPEADWLDPATGARAMISAVARAGQIEARHFGEVTPVEVADDWVEIGVASTDYFDMLIGRAVGERIPAEDLSELRHLRDEMSSAFGRIPGC